MGRNRRTRIYVSSFDLLFVLFLSDLLPFRKRGAKLGRQYSIFVIESYIRFDTRDGMFFTDTADLAASHCNLEDYLPRTHMHHSRIVSLVGFPREGSAYPIHDSSGCSCFILDLCFPSSLHHTVIVFIDISLTLLRYRVPLHERYQDVCFCILFVLIMYSFHVRSCQRQRDR